jgi:hypothetical protein
MASAPGLTFLGLNSAQVQMLSQTENTPVFLHGATVPAQVNGLAANALSQVLAVAHAAGITLMSYLPLDVEPEPPVVVPGSYAVAAYPNPFNATVTLKLSAPAPGIYRLTVFDLLGREVSGNDVQLPAQNRYDVPFTGLASGHYFARLSGANASVIARLVYLP